MSEWIPVKNKLPEVNNKWYLVTYIANDIPLVRKLFFKDNRWIDNIRKDMIQTYEVYGTVVDEQHRFVRKQLTVADVKDSLDLTDDVIAWMPLPEPYKAESEDIDGND